MAEEAAKTAVQAGIDPVEAGKKAAAAFARFRFHDLRHQAITELAEKGAADATLMALAGHLSREMMEHYRHVRMDAKREATDLLGSGFVKSQQEAETAPSEAVN